MNVLKSLVKQIKKYVLTKRNLAVVALLISLIYFSKASHYGVPTIKLNYFLTALSRNYLSEVYLSGSTLKFKGENSSWYQTDISLLSEKRLGKIMIEYPNVNFTRAENILTTFNRSSLLIYGMAFVVLIQFFRFLSGFHQVGFRENKKLVNPSVKFSNVCGLESAKQELKQIIEFLNNSEKFLNIGARIRRGILLFGPPGTGKTLLAKALAGEANLPFISCVGSEFNEIYVGTGQKKIREIFNLARKKSPCIIFIDEIDGLGSRSSRKAPYMDNEEIAKTINQLLSEIDGFKENSMIFIIAATSKIHLVDEALLRSGRFDLKLKIGLPDENDRVQLLQTFLEKKKCNEIVIKSDLMEFSKQLIMCSGADLENFVNECSYNAIREGREQIEYRDLEEALKKIIRQKKEERNFKI